MGIIFAEIGGIMNGAITLNEEKRVKERRSLHDRRAVIREREASQREEGLLREQHTYIRMLDLLGSALAVIVSIIVLISTGLSSAASSTEVQIILIVSIASFYVVMFRSALYS